MIVLGIETSTTVCAAAVAGDGAVRADAWVDERNVHAEMLLLQVDRVLTAAGVPLKELSGIAVSIGPGSFTGLRIGLSVAKGLAYAAGIPIVAVPTLHALAARTIAEEALPPGCAVLALIDARRDEAYAQLFTANEGRAVPAGDVRAEDLGMILAQTAGEEIVITGDAHRKAREAMEKLPPSTRGRYRFAGESASRCSAATVALLGEDLLRAGAADEPGSLEPRYMKEFFLNHR